MKPKAQKYTAMALLFASLVMSVLPWMTALGYHIGFLPVAMICGFALFTGATGDLGFFAFLIFLLGISLFVTWAMSIHSVDKKEGKATIAYFAMTLVCFLSVYPVFKGNQFLDLEIWAWLCPAFALAGMIAALPDFGAMQARQAYRRAGGTSPGAKHATATAALRYCVKCGDALPKGAGFCTRCGASQRDPGNRS